MQNAQTSKVKSVLTTLHRRAKPASVLPSRSSTSAFGPSGFSAQACKYSSSISNSMSR